MSDDNFGGTDSVTEVTTTGWVQRIGQSFIGALFGILLVIGSIVLLWWNEGRAVEAITALNRGAHIVVEARADAVDAGDDGKLVHLSGAAATKAPVRDDAFGVAGGGLLRLKRTVEMFQWAEQKSTTTHKNLGGSETKETTYSYHKEWSAQPVDSRHFHESNGHQNPAMPVRSQTFDSADARLGPYRIDRSLLDEVSAFTAFDPQAANPPAGYRKTGDLLYRGDSESSPAIGDIRIRYTAVAAQSLSLVATQNSGGVLAPYRGGDGYKIALAETGFVPAAAMFKDKAHEESVITWILRAVGFVLMLIGFALMASPLSVLVGAIPLFESIVGAGAFLLALIVSVPLTLLIIAAAWIAHRPLLGIGLIVAAIGLAFVLRRLHRRPQPPAPTHFLPEGMLR